MSINFPWGATSILRRATAEMVEEAGAVPAALGCVGFGASGLGFGVESFKFGV
jgi:hypothetical protein